MTLSGTSTSIISPVSVIFHCLICVDMRADSSANSPTHMHMGSIECMPRIVSADTPPDSFASHAFDFARSGTPGEIIAIVTASTSPTYPCAMRSRA